MAELLPILQGTAWARETGLDRVRDVDGFRGMPVVGYADVRPFVDRICGGEPDVLTTEPVEMLERTGGSAGGDKLIPYTKRLRAEFAQAVGAWMVDLHVGEPRLLGTASYWSVSRAVRRPERTAGALRVGFDDDAEYFGPVERWAIAQLMAVDSSVARSPDIAAWRRATLTALVECRDLGLISVWSPSFLTGLMDALVGAELALSREARVRLDRALAADLDASVLWPRLRVVSAWGDGFAGRLVPAMLGPFRRVRFQPKGVLATEGVVSFPLVGWEGGVLAVTSHLIELREVGGGAVRWADEVEVGGRYQPILTTGGGLVRYALPDELEVLGFVDEIPRVRLVGRLDRGSDLVGEKLTAPFVDGVVAAVAPGAGFAMLIPAEDPLRYVLVVDRPGTGDVEAALAETYHYAYARELGQLGPAEVRVVPDAWARWERGVEAAGLTLGDQKPQALETRGAVVAALIGR